MKYFIKVALIIIMLFLYSINIIAQPPNILRVEYYIDTDRGYGNGTAISLGIPKKDFSKLSFTLNFSTLANGVHSVGIRSKDANGVWSLDNRYLFAKLPNGGVEQATRVLKRTEYYVNNDPGYGKGIPVILAGSNYDKTGSFTLNITNFPYGVSMVAVRSKDAKGAWSSDNKYLFAKMPDGGIAQTTPFLTRTEYYINNDPGYGNGTPVTVTGSDSGTTGSFTLDITSFPYGVSVVGVRSKDANGRWSQDNKWLFAKVPQEKIPLNITRAEYYFDADPGWGKGFQVAIKKTADLPGIIINANITGLSNGKHYIFYRTKDSAGAWSHDNADSFNLPPYNAAPAIIVNSVADTIFCARDSFSVGYQASGSYTPGNTFNVYLSDATGSFNAERQIGSIKAVQSGLIVCHLPGHLNYGNGYKLRIKSSSPAVSGLTSVYTFIIHDRPKIQTITGAGDANVTLNYNYSSPADTGSTWKWIAPAATITQTMNSANLIWNTAGLLYAVKVIEINQYGCIGDTSSKTVNVYTLKIDSVVASSLTPCPAETITITGKANGVYNSGNKFTAQLSNSSGSFRSHITIGKVSGHPVGISQLVIINAKLPFPIANGKGYRVRIVASSPAITGSNNDRNIVISKPNLGNDTTLRKFIGETFNLSTLYTDTTLTYIWNTLNPLAVDTGSYRVIAINNNGCKDTAFVSIINYPNPAILRDKRINKSQAVAAAKNAEIQGKRNLLRLMFNPVKNQALLTYECLEDKKVMIRVSDNLGRIVIIKKLRVNAGGNEIPLRTDNMAQGIYIVELLSANDQEHVSMIKE